MKRTKLMIAAVAVGSMMMVGCECDRKVKEYMVACSDGFETGWEVIEDSPVVRDGYVVYYQNKKPQFYEIPKEVLCVTPSRWKPNKDAKERYK